MTTKPTPNEPSTACVACKSCGDEFPQTVREDAERWRAAVEAAARADERERTVWEVCEYVATIRNINNGPELARVLARKFGKGRG